MPEAFRTCGRGRDHCPTPRLRSAAVDIEHLPRGELSVKLAERIDRLEQEIAGLAEDQRRTDELIAEIHELVRQRVIGDEDPDRPAEAV